MILRTSTILLTLSVCSRTTYAAFDLFGLRKSIYNPRCAHACREPISSLKLQCTSDLTQKTSPACYATDDIFLQTLGFCISRHCKVGLDELESYWAHYVAGWQLSDPVPKYNYETAIKLAGTPKQVAPSQGSLKQVSTISDEDYDRSYASLVDWTDNENLHARYASSAAFTSSIHTRVQQARLKWRAHFVYPTVWSHQWSMQIREAGDISPTRGQACFILYMLALNVVFLTTSHYGSMYSSWTFDGRQGQLITCIANRFGAMTLANIPLLFLYAGRNNFLLWLTNWSHTTFIMLHRWLGYFVIAEAVIHSVLYLHVAVVRHSHTAWSHVPAWYFGSIGTISLSLIAPLSIVWIRKRRYEVFLFIHITVTILALVGTYFHISHLYNTQTSGWVVYLWACVFLWSFDRVVRVIRLFFNGVKNATITIIDEEYIRVDIPNAVGSGHVYLYFPTLTWRFWENHPFSIATAPRRVADQRYSDRLKWEQETNPLGLDTRVYSPRYSIDKDSPMYDTKSLEKELGSPMSSKSPLSPLTPITPMSIFPLMSPLSPFSTNQMFGGRTPGEKEKGLTFFLRTQTGTTAHLRQRTSIPVLVEASYGPSKDMSMYPILICVAGGVGITAVLPYLHGHTGTTRLYWGSRSQGLVNAMRDETHGYNGEIIVGRRLFVKLVLQREMARFDRSAPVAIVVSGPKAMCEEVREFCCEIAVKRSGEVRFLDENVSW